MRPIGALIFGYIGDKHGRKASLALSILLMAIPTSFIGLLPTYGQIGILAPILLTVIRLMQGMALGGEFSGSITFLVEHAPKDKKGLAGSYSVMSLVMGILLGSAVATFFANVLDKEDFETWGWRVPFIIGFFIGMVGLYIRSFLDESPDYEHAKEYNQLSEKPVRELLTKHFGKIVLATGLYMAVTIPFYMLTVFMNTFMTKIVGFEMSDSLIINTISMFALLALIPLSAILSDKFGRKPVLLISVIVILLAAYPIFWLICQGSFSLALIGQVFFAAILAFYIAPIPTVLVEIFPTKVRYTGMAIACNLCAAIFGGTTPIIATWLIEKTGTNLILSVYIAAAALISLVSVLVYKETGKKKKA
jgi:MHS family proline/betaine transporter-like MFS transporter